MMLERGTRMPLEHSCTLQEELALIWVLLISTVVATFFIQHYKITYIPPSGAAMALGMVYGGFAKLAGDLLHRPSAYLHDSIRAEGLRPLTSNACLW